MYIKYIVIIHDIVVGYQLTESKNLRRFNHQLEQVYPSQNYPPDIFEQE
jgi:hypothetical protein